MTEEDPDLHLEYIIRSQSNFMTFVRGLRLPSGYGPVIFDKVMQEHQKESFELMAPSLHALQVGEMPPLRRFWLERTKKAGKDSDLAAVLIWLLSFPVRPLYMQVGAADRDQASIIKRRMQTYLHYNSWLNDYIKIVANKVKSVCGKAELDILAADIQGSHGETPDLLICNELSHVQKWEFMENLLDNAAGVPQGIVIIATNAGFKGTKAHVLREKNIVSDDWTCQLFKQPSPWLTEEDLRDARLRNTPSRYRRLFEGIWASGKGDAFDDELIDRIFSGELEELVGPLPGWEYLMGIDLGVSKDHAGLIVLGVSRSERRIQVATMRGYEPLVSNNNEVDLIKARDDALALYRTFRCRLVAFDPHQAILMSQELRRYGCQCVKMPFTGNRIAEMATAMIDAARQGLLKSYEDKDGRLRRDLGKFNIVEKAYGYKLEAVSDETGHADVGTALAIALPLAIKFLESGHYTEEDQFIYEPVKVTKEVIEAMPPALRDIYDAHDKAEKEWRANRRESVRDMF